MTERERQSESLPGKRRWLQYSLRGLLLLMTLSAIGLAMWTGRSRKQRLAVEMLAGRGGYVQYSTARANMPGLGWLRNRLGVDFVDCVDGAQLVGDSFSDADLEHLDGLPGLEHLALVCPNVSEAGLARIESLHHLKSLELGGPGVSDQTFCHLEGLRELVQLTIEPCAITDAGSQRARPASPQPKAASGRAAVAPAIRAGFGALYSTTQVDFTNVPLKDACEYLQDLHRVEIQISPDVLRNAASHDDFPITYAVRGSSLASALSTMLRPRGLDWTMGREGLLVTTRDRAATARTRFTGTGFDRLKGLVQLQVLVIRLPEFDGSGLKCLSSLPQLRELDLRATRIDDGAMEPLGNLRQLQDLGLSGTQVSDGGLESLAGLTGLQNLDLMSTRVTGAGLKHLRGLSNLRSLNLANTQVSDAGLAWLESLPNLERLDLCEVAITDLGLKHVQRLPRLEHLVLFGTKVTDAGLKDLRQVPQLRFVLLPSGVTPQGKTRLQQALPKCQVR